MKIAIQSKVILPAVLALLANGLSAAAAAQQSQAEIAKKLNNPIADLVSVPFQFNYDGDLGPTQKGERYTLNIQPVIPININDEWNVISRTIVPVVKLEDAPPGKDEDGIGDVLQSFFFLPSALVDGWTWGVAGTLRLLGHSYGGVVALHLAGLMAAGPPEHIYGLGIKSVWAEDELAGMHRLAQKPQKLYPDAESARQWYLKVAGSAGMAPTGMDCGARGIVEAPGSGVYPPSPVYSPKSADSRCPCHRRY
ncbi:MAG: hypothetical protein V2I26_18450 [Halieaceae bacterium]|nr:hypothetical protein [Halieaceae bacterium]